MQLINKWKNLPNELINLILDYSNVVLYRNGVYINRIPKNDPRYDLLKTIKLPIYSNYYTLIRLFNYENNVFIYIYYYNYDQLLGKGHKSYDLLYKSSSTYEKYKFDANSIWRKYVDYSM